MESVTTTIGFAIFTTILMVVIEGILYFSERSVRHLHVLLFWLAYLFYFLVSAITQNHGPEIVALSTFIWVLRTMALTKVLSDVAGDNLEKSWHKYAQIIAYASGVIIYLSGGSFTFFTLPPAIANLIVGLDLIIETRHCLMKRDRIHLTHKFLLFTVFVISVHLLNYPLFRWQHSLSGFGMGVVLLTTILLAIILPAVTVYELLRDRQKVLENIIIDRAKQLTDQSKFASLGVMTAGIVHEILNPLSVMKHRSSLLRSLVLKDKADKEVLLKNLDQIELTGERMSKIINSLRKFSKTTRKESLAVESVATIIEDTLSYCTDRFYHNNVPLNVEPYPPMDIEVRAVEISQVLLNLLNNAYDAVKGTPDPWVKIEFKDFGHFLEIRVVDSGSGIPAAIRNKIMEPFFTTKEDEGTGLGLPISAGIIRNHQGKLYYDENEAHTTFVIELPYRLIKA